MTQFWPHEDTFGLLAWMMKTLYMVRGISYFSGGTLGVNKTALETGFTTVGKYKL